MKALEREYLAILQRDCARTLADWEKYRHYLRTCTAISNDGRHLDAGLLPKLFDESSFELLKRVAKTTSGILNKVISHYLEDADYRSLFPFSPELERLILTDVGYSCNLPVFRMDIFFDEEKGTFKFCEINTDGTSAMNEQRELSNAARHTAAFKEFAEGRELTSFELFDSWASRFLAWCGECGKPHPHVAIVDFLESATRNEFYIFERAFQRAGVSCTVQEIRDLKYENGALFGKDGVKIDAVYRRAVTSECMEKRGDISAFLQAVLDGAVTVVGGFRTQVVHTKHFFVIARLPQTKAILTDEENAFVEEHFPVTHRLCDVPLQEVLAGRESLLVKPADRYGSKGVCAGADCSDEEWKREIEEDVSRDYVVQNYCTPYRAPNVFVEDEKPVTADFNNMTGLFVYGGELAGLYSRQVRSRVTSDRDEGKVAPCFVVKEKRE